jgi:hypothetical protein
MDRFLAVVISRKAFDAHLIGGRITVAGERIADPTTPAPPPLAIAIMLDPEQCLSRGSRARVGRRAPSTTAA